MPRFLHIDNLKNNSLDLNGLLIKHPAATFFFKVEGKDPKLKLDTGDLLIVDRSLNPTYQQLVLTVQEGEIRIQKFCTTVSEIWGVITHIIHKTH